MTTPQALTPPPPLDMDNAFAKVTMAERVPAILRETQAANPDYPPAIQRALGELHDALVANAPIPLLSGPAPEPDWDDWTAAHREAQAAQTGPLTWHHTPWFFAETYSYRLLMQVVRWHETHRDPFAPKKTPELANDHLWELLEAALRIEGDFETRLFELMLAALWGNRADLSHPAGALARAEAAEDELLADERQTAARYLAAGTAEGRAGVHLVLDNGGVELALDLALADLLLTHGGEQVVLHAKDHPTYVSDATIPDVWRMIEAMQARGAAVRAAGERLHAAWEVGQLVLGAHPFWTSSRFWRAMPAVLSDALVRARLIVLKGDVNYRRAVSDALWDPALSFADVMRFFPAPILALRSVKSDPLVGAQVERVRALDEAEPGWRVTGRYGVIQFAGCAE